MASSGNGGVKRDGKEFDSLITTDVISVLSIQ